MNIHSHSGGVDERKIRLLGEFLLRERPDAVALQEVCQTQSAPACASLPGGWTVLGEEIPLRKDHVLVGLCGILGEEYHACWLPVKLGYGTLDEGLAFLCRAPIAEAEEILLTPDRPYEDWRRRSALSVRTEGSETRFVCLHTSWWEEGFLGEWERLASHCKRFPAVCLMGDFNVSAERLCREGDPLRKAGYHDAYLLARNRDPEDTVLPQADGWWGRERTDGLRIDQIRCRPPVSVARYRRIFDGRSEPVISDHFGIMIETEENGYDRTWA